MSENIEINEDNCVLDDEELRILKYAAVEFGQYQSKMNQAVVPKIVLKVQKLNEMAKEKQETEKIGLLGKDADAIVFSEYSIGKEFKEKGK